MIESLRQASQSAVTLAEVKPVLALFAQALAGATVALREDTSVAAPRAGATASPATITLPPQIAWFATERDNRAAYRIAVMRQVLAAPDDNSLSTLLAEGSVSWRRIVRSLERLRIDAMLARQFPGARSDLSRQRTHELTQHPPLPPRRWPLQRTLDTLAQYALGAAPPRVAATDDSAALRTLLRHADTLIAAGAGPLDSARVGSLICGLLGVPARAKAPVSAFASARTTPAMLATAQGTDPARTRDATAVDAGSTDGAALTPAQATGHVNSGTIASSRTSHGATAANAVHRPHAGPRRAAPPRTQRDLHTARASTPDGTEPPGRAHAIDEWDYRQQRMLPHWCTLVERRLHGDDTAFIRTARRRHAELAQRVHRQFAAWRPDGLRRVHGASDGDEVELDRVIEAMVDRRAGLLDDRAWYVRRDRAQRDVATAFLVDTSASTDFALPEAMVGPPRPAPSVQADAVYLYDLVLSAPPPSPPKRRVIDVAKDALALMCDALHTLGDCFAVYTFSGQGRAQVDFRIVKSFDDTVSSRTAGALAALRPHGATRTGAAIRHAAGQLARQPQRRRALIVVTDGYPEDIDYGPEPRDLRYGVEDTAHALREAQALGVHTFCLSIDPAGHDYLRRMCPPQRYMVISDLAALPSELAKVYRALTRGRHDE